MNRSHQVCCRPFQTDGIERRKCVGLVLADVHELKKEVTIVSSSRIVDVRGRNNEGNTVMGHSPECTIDSISIELFIRCPDIARVFDPVEVLNDTSRGKGRRGVQVVQAS